MFVLIVGNVIDGLQLIGPFETAELANLYAEPITGEDWIVARLAPPKEA